MSVLSMLSNPLSNTAYCIFFFLFHNYVVAESGRGITVLVVAAHIFGGLFPPYGASLSSFNIK